MWKICVYFSLVSRQSCDSKQTHEYIKEKPDKEEKYGAKNWKIYSEIKNKNTKYCVHHKTLEINIILYKYWYEMLSFYGQY